MKVNAQEMQDSGTILFYVDPDTRDVIYATDGIDNHNFYSYIGLKNEGSLSTPTRLAHYDLWFNRQYSPREIEGFTHLLMDSESAFFYKAAEIEGKIKDWSEILTYGIVLPDGSKLIMSAKNDKWVKGVAQFFTNSGLTRLNSVVYVNGIDIGTVDILLNGEEVMETEVEKDKEILGLVTAWKQGDNDAGFLLIQKFDKMITTIVNDQMKICRASKVDKDDLIQESYLKFLDKLRTEYDPNKSKVSSYIFYHVTGVTRNMLNRQKTQEITNYYDETGRSKFEGLEAKKIDAVKALIESDYLKSLVDRLPEKLKMSMKLYFYDGKNIEAVGKHFGLSRQRAHQLIKTAIDRLRYNPRVSELDWMEIEKLKQTLIFDNPQ